MTEPTIDEMLAWLDSLTYDGYNNTPCNNAIRAILEQYRDKDTPYRERNKLVAYVAKIFPSHLSLHPAEDATWEPDWRNIVCVHSPAGQMTWHIHDSEAVQFSFLDMTTDCEWDGHSTEEKYRRLESLRGSQLEAVRAFVERVEQRLPDYDTGRGAEAWLKGYHRAIRDELAGMEKETE